MLQFSSNGAAAPGAEPTGTVSVWVYGSGAGLRLPVAVELVSQVYHRQLTLTRSNPSAPGCGAAANRFTDVPPGIYDWIATTGQTPPMQGRLQVRAGQCTSQQVTVNGSTNATGSVMFWAQAKQRRLLTPAPAITLTRATPATRYVTAAYTSQPPCNEPGGALYADLPPGSYRFVTSGGVLPASGVVNVIPGTCVTKALAVSTPGILATGPVQGSGFSGSLATTSGTSSGTTSSSGNVGTTSSGPPLGATSGTTNSTTSNISSTTTSSSTSGATTGSTAGATTSATTSGSTTSTTRGNTPGRTPGSCASMNDYVSVVSNATGTVCGNANSRSLTVRNNSGVTLGIRVGLERADGTYNCGASLRVLPGATFTQQSCTSTGRYFIQSMKYDDWLAGCRMGDQGCQ